MQQNDKQSQILIAGQRAKGGLAEMAQPDQRTEEVGRFLGLGVTQLERPAQAHVIPSPARSIYSSASAFLCLSWRSPKSPKYYNLQIDRPLILRI